MIFFFGLLNKSFNLQALRRAEAEKLRRESLTKTNLEMIEQRLKSRVNFRIIEGFTIF